ncbi:MAG: VOC family protein [Bacteroidia bacterium]|nr:VOC family protein [Bacteroidales bacterium]NCD43161.1 VOC family protein [Bacteroidia bacterium]MDD2322598.1 VOC family protein [Bacteroidales bacterium]MDD3010431.1 VOC family protein [Bacteroidales bacterium]MDD3961879.1 VOC family protein [Bacteroidales bacterium]
MKLNHIALNINHVDDILNFYQNMLGMQLQYQFTLSASLSRAFFGFDQELPVYFYQKDHVAFELFVTSKKINNGIAHACLEIPDRESFIAQCQDMGYPVNCVERDSKPNLVFVWDKSGNCFEIKEE